MRRNAGAKLNENILDQQTDEIIKGRIRSAYKCSKKEYIFVCDKVLLWESENHHNKFNCQVVELENEDMDFAMLANSINCFMCNQAHQDIESLLFHYMMNHRETFMFNVLTISNGT